MLTTRSFINNYLILKWPEINRAVLTLTNRSVKKKFVMSPRSAKQLDTIRKLKKELILDVSLKLFAENGYHATSISQIAKQAKISKGLTYNYFNSKKEILDEIIRIGFDSIYSNFDINGDGILTENEFRNFIRQAFILMNKNPQFWKLYFALMLQPNVLESYKADYSQQAQKLFELFYRFVVNAGSKDPESDMLLISVLLKGAFLTTVTAPEFFPFEKIEKKLIDTCFKIIKG